MSSRLRLALWGCLLLNLLLLPWPVMRAVGFPFGLDYGEAPLADQAARVLAGQTLYKANLNEPPYVITNYGPLYPTAIALVSRVTGRPLLTAGRIISICAALLCTLLIDLFALKLTGDRLAGALAATLFLGNPLVIYWSSLARVDLLALCFSLSALYILYRRPRSWRWLGVAVALMIAAIYTRQTAIFAVPLAGAVWLWHIAPKRSLVFLVALSVIGLALYGIANLATAGGFYLHTVVANANRYDLAHLGRMSGRLLQIWPFGILVAGLAAWQTLGRRRQASVAGQPAEAPAFLRYGVAAFTVGALVSALTVGKVGSNVNYFLDLLAALALWAGTSLTWGKRNRFAVGLAGLLLAQLIWASIGDVISLNSSVNAQWQHVDESQALYAEIVAAAATGPVLADDTMDMVVLAGQPLYLQPFEYAQLYRAGLWDPSALVTAIEGRQFPLIITVNPGTALNRERWPAPIMAAIEDHYTVERTFRNSTLYRPTPGLPENYGEPDKDLGFSIWNGGFSRFRGQREQPAKASSPEDYLNFYGSG
ncbi:MAG: glycosyltransferase family 39 protein [Chloroflexi bacterium]|nr:glycosyltransferase family 39 protein [Chloroflexota bacterium]